MVPPTSSMPIKYTQLDSTEYTQRTLGNMNGFVIETDQIQLRPLHLEQDAPRMWKVYKNHPELFQYMPDGPLYTYEAFYKGQKHFCDSGLFFNWTVYVAAKTAAAPTTDQNTDQDTKATSLVDNKKWVLCGSICLLDIVLSHRKFEVGAIWFHPSVHGTFVMLETTYALLRFSFEKLRAGRVCWKTHHKNIASQKAAKKLGFREEGLFRKHLIHADGTWRHTWFYSMTDDEWFGRTEETMDGRKGLEVVPGWVTSEEEEGKVAKEGAVQKQLEDLIGLKKREGKMLPEGIVRGEALE